MKNCWSLTFTNLGLIFSSMYIPMMQSAIVVEIKNCANYFRVFIFNITFFFLFNFKNEFQTKQI